MDGVCKWVSNKWFLFPQIPDDKNLVLVGKACKMPHPSGRLYADGCRILESTKIHAHIPRLLAIMSWHRGVWLENDC